MTQYEISTHLPGIPGTDPNDAWQIDAWQPVGTITTTQGAPTAIRKWAEQQGEHFAGGRLRAIPTNNITERTISVQTKLHLTLGKP